MRQIAFLAKFFVFMGIFLSTNSEAKLNPQNIDKIKFGMKPAEAEKILGSPDKKSSSEWIYGEEKSPILRLEWQKKLMHAEAYGEVPEVPNSLRLQELQQVNKSDTPSHTKFVAHPESGRIWEINIAGKPVGFTVQSPWKSRFAGKKLEELFPVTQKAENTK